MPEQSRLALAGATVYTAPGLEPIQNATVLIERNMVVAVGSRGKVHVGNARVLDCSGCSVLAGFWNSHVHFFERKWSDAKTIPVPEMELQLRETFTRYGFTSVFDLSSQWENTRCIRDRVASGEVKGPSIHSTGEGLIAPGALPPEHVLNLMGAMLVPLPEVSNEAQAAAAAKKLLECGVDGIKLFASSPRSETLSQEIIAAAVQEAHAAGKPVFVHPNNAGDVLNALRAGVDVIAHTTPYPDDWDEAISAALRERPAAITPTLSLWKYFARHERASRQQRVTSAGVKQLRLWREAGGDVLFGTDLGAVDPDPREEYVLMADAGMRFDDILASLTTLPAKHFGSACDSGRIAEGSPADLVVVSGNPAQDTTALANVKYTLRAGTIVYA